MPIIKTKAKKLHPKDYDAYMSSLNLSPWTNIQQMYAQNQMFPY